MIQNYLRGNTQFVDSVSTWQEGVQLAAKPLLEQHVITGDYIKAMLQNVVENGNYIIILPEVAMPHARHEFGALKTGISFLRLKQAINFPKEMPVRLFFALASESNNGHLDLLAELGEALSDPEKVEELMNANNESEVLAVFDDEG